VVGCSSEQRETLFLYRLFVIGYKDYPAGDADFIARFRSISFARPMAANSKH